VTLDRTSRASLLAEQLGAHFRSVATLGFGLWKCSFPNGQAHPLTARLTSDGWLLLDSVLYEDPSLEMAGPCLELNCHLGGVGKLAFAPGKRSLHLRAEIPLDDGIDVPARLRETLEGFNASLRCFRERGSDPKPNPSLSAPLAAPPVDLASLCAELGWPFVERAGVLSVNLETERAAYKAVVQIEEKRFVRVAVELAPCAAWSAPSRQALAVLLLAACGMVRLARAVVYESSGAETAGFEVRFTGTPSADELKHALASLSVACCLCALEAKAMEDESLASAYLAVRGWPC